jgi:hypothetical protein
MESGPRGDDQFGSINWVMGMAQRNVGRCSGLAFTRIENRSTAMQESHYRYLLIMAVLSFASMFVLMYAMVNSFANVYVNIN